MGWSFSEKVEHIKHLKQFLLWMCVFEFRMLFWCFVLYDSIAVTTGCNKR